MSNQYTKQNVFDIERDMLGMAGRDLGLTLYPTFTHHEHDIFVKYLRQYAKELRDSIKEESNG